MYLSNNHIFINQYKADVFDTDVVKNSLLASSSKSTLVHTCHALRRLHIKDPMLTLKQDALRPVR